MNKNQSTIEQINTYRSDKDSVYHKYHRADNVYLADALFVGEQEGN